MIKSDAQRERTAAQLQGFRQALAKVDREVSDPGGLRTILLYIGNHEISIARKAGSGATAGQSPRCRPFGSRLFTTWSV